MKTPLRYQITEFDCGTISLLNAFSYLFERDEIPAEIIKAIHKYTLDVYDDEGNLGQGGTSREAIEEFTNWISDYATANNYNIICKRLEKEQVTLKNIQTCLDVMGCALVRCWQEVEHYVIITKIDDDFVYIFDPYYMEPEEYADDAEVEFVLDKPFDYNRKVTLNRVFSENYEDFSLGKYCMRECVLINKK